MRHFVICITICLCILKTEAATSSVTDSLELRCAWLERYVFFYPEDRAARFELAQLMCASGRAEEGMAHFNKVTETAHDSLGLEAAINSCRWLIKTGKAGSCREKATILLAGDSTMPDAWQRRFRFYVMLGYLEENRLQDCVEQALILAGPVGDSVISAAWQHYLNNRVSPRKAMRLSIVPGLGQWYAHDRSAALNAFLLNGAIAGLSYVQFRKLPLFGLVLLVQFFPRYYSGNIVNAGKSAVFRNNGLRNALKHTIVRVLAQEAVAGD